jgi:hypothetical protein
MTLDLDSLCSEIRDYLRSNGVAVFHGASRAVEETPTVYWDTQKHPDYRSFVAAAQAAGVRLVTIHVDEFDEELLDDALERVAQVPREQRREIEPRLREMRRYTGTTCQIELSFDLAPRIYLFDLRTEWFEEFNDMLDQIDEVIPDEDDDALGGSYFSNN